MVRESFSFSFCFSGDDMQVKASLCCSISLDTCQFFFLTKRKKFLMPKAFCEQQYLAGIELCCLLSVALV